MLANVTNTGTTVVLQPMGEKNLFPDTKRQKEIRETSTLIEE